MHHLIIGRTNTGKSSLAKSLGLSLRNRGEEILAFNPTGERGYTRGENPCAVYETDNPHAFTGEILRRLNESQRTRFLIIDECHEFFSRGDNDYLWIGTRGRHYGLNVIGISQRGALVNPTFRGQCASLYLFQCSLTDANFLADEFGAPDLKSAPGLSAGHFIKYADGRTTRHALFTRERADDKQSAQTGE